MPTWHHSLSVATKARCMLGLAVALGTSSTQWMDSATMAAVGLRGECLEGEVAGGAAARARRAACHKGMVLKEVCQGMGMVAPRVLVILIKAGWQTLEDMMVGLARTSRGRSLHSPAGTLMILSSMVMGSILQQRSTRSSLGLRSQTSFLDPKAAISSFDDELCVHHCRCSAALAPAAGFACTVSYGYDETYVYIRGRWQHIIVSSGWGVQAT